MSWKNRWIFSVVTITAAVIFSPVSFGVQQKAQPGTANPLIQEMNLLDRVFRDIVSGVALSDGHRVHAAIEKMHGTMEKTHEGVTLGTVKLGKNAERLKEFVEQDKQFHTTLEDLAGAARKNDSATMVSLTQKLLYGCVQCHQEFRKA